MISTKKDKYNEVQTSHDRRQRDRNVCKAKHSDHFVKKRITAAMLRLTANTVAHV